MNWKRTLKHTTSFRMFRKHQISIFLSALILVAIPLEAHQNQPPYFFLEELELEKIETNYLDGEGDELKKSAGNNSFGIPSKYGCGSYHIPSLPETHAPSKRYGYEKQVPLYILYSRLKVDPLHI